MALPGKLFIVSAPSGTGKTTVVNAVLADIGAQYSVYKVITYTTKAIQPGELQGVDYHFITEDEFQQKIAQGFFIEWSLAYGHYYGSPRSIIADLARGVSCVAILDRAGAQAIMDQRQDAILIWLYPASLQILRDRLVGRGRDEAAAINRRLLLAEQELNQEKNTPIFHHHVLNDDFNTTIFLINSIVRQALDKSL